MNNNVLQIKFKERINKRSSLDYDNIECWQIAEAFNKAQIEWVRRQIRGINQKKEGDESTKMSIDDLQILLNPIPIPITGTQRGDYFLTEVLPDDYLYYKSVNADAKTDCCPIRPLRVYLGEVANEPDYLRDMHKKPSAKWGHTFATISGNRIKIFTQNEFEIANSSLYYYRKPREISFTNCVSMSTGAPTLDVESEFKDDIVEIIIDEACSILAGDIESLNQYQREKQQGINNT